MTGSRVRSRLRRQIVPLLILACSHVAFALGEPTYVDETRGRGSFPLADVGSTATIVVDTEDHAGVIRAARDLQADIERVTTRRPALVHQPSGAAANTVIVGTIGKSRLIDDLVRDGRLDVADVKGKWEAFLLQVIPKPLPGVDSALVIAGSDKRGTIYGIYDLSEQIGVSPWYWWADVPVRRHDKLFVRPGRHVHGEPAVRYRGIFLNDEAPALTGWVREKFGNYNHQFYTRVFELLLRLKGNYLWPAMWDNAFNEDDPLNPKLADEYGIVMGTSHHEPMLRAQQEWKRHGSGPWDYSRNGEVLRRFWADGVRRNKAYESITTIGMRGDGDEPMTETANIELLERIVADQRKILAEEVNPDVTKIPQDWALYKEVQEYYEKGMRVPDDVTLLWCDDNWGNVRRLPTPQERKRSGGAGIYYHFDYVGGPRSYKWLNTIPITKVWEQMNLAYEYDARRIWIVNVGDLKPMEFPIEFFLTFSQNPRQWPKERLQEYGRLWAEREFGPAHAAEIADIVARYTKYNGRRKPELLTPETFDIPGGEADRVLAEWKTIAEKAERLQAELPEQARDAFFQLVLYPAKASAIVTELYIAAGKNRLYAKQGRASANDYAARVQELFRADADLAAMYNRGIANGKWNHMMDQTHIGYTYWNQPPENVAPEVTRLEIADKAEMGVAVEGSSSAWPGDNAEPRLPQFDSFHRQSRWIEVFNRGSQPFSFRTATSAPWIKVSAAAGTVSKDEKLAVSIDWKAMPAGTQAGWIKITGPDGGEATVHLSAENSKLPGNIQPGTFVEANGYVSIEAEHYTRNESAGSVRWEKVPDYGRTLSSMTIFPVTAASVTPPLDSPLLEYSVYLQNSGKVEVEAIVAPTLNFVPGRGLRFGISFDDQPPQIVDVLADTSLKAWERSVEDSVRRTISAHTLKSAGPHVLKMWMVDPGLVLQKLIVKTGDLEPSYLGPPESARTGQAEAVLTGEK